MKISSYMFVLSLLVNANASEEVNIQASIVKTAFVKEGNINLTQNYVGTLYYDRLSHIATESSGMIEKVYVKEGDSVKQGDKLLTLEHSILEATVKAKSSHLKAMIAEQVKTHKDLQRAKVLLDRKSISQSSFDTTYYKSEALNARVNAMQNELHALKIKLQKKTVHSPFNGIVVKRNIDIGEWVAAGEDVYTLVDPKSIEAKINVPNTLLPTLLPEQYLSANILGKDIDVKVKTLIPLADQASRTFPVELQLKTHENFIGGMRIDVKVPTLKQGKSLLVPRDAVIKRFGKFVVFTVVNDTAIMHPVQVLSYKGSQAAILSDKLTAHMEVITKGNERIFPNTPIIRKDNQ